LPTQPKSNHYVSMLIVYISTHIQLFSVVFTAICCNFTVCSCRFCVTDPPRQTLRSDSNELLVLFRSYDHSLVCDEVQFPWKCHRYNIGFKAKFYTSKYLLYVAVLKVACFFCVNQGFMQPPRRGEYSPPENICIPPDQAQ